MLTKERSIPYLICLVVLCIPAFFWNLGVMPFIEDEAIRAIVAFEMLHSGNYIMPTINGDPYYYKPPLYNWFIVLSYKLFGVANEWSARFPTVIFLFGYIYYVFKKNFKQRGHYELAIATALCTLTCGRILFYDSFLGLIDICFSWVTFALLINFYDLRKQGWRLLLIYFLAAIAYMLKGFPSFVFLACGMMGYVAYFREFRQFWTKWHLFGILTLASILGSYYYAYSTFHDASRTFAPLLEQSTIRTFLYNDIMKVVKHVVSFPFENVFHFLPWSLLSIFIYYWWKEKKIKLDTYSEFLGLVFLINIGVYWISPGYYPRYVLMLVPFYFAYFFGYYFTRKGDMLTQIFDYLIMGLIGLVSLASFGARFIPGLAESNLGYGVAIGVGILGVVLLYLISKKTIPVWIGMVFLLLGSRIQYNSYVLPNRSQGLKTVSKVQAKYIASNFAPLHLYQNARMDRSSSFYLATTVGKPMLRKQTIEPDTYYIVDTISTPIPDHVVVLDSLPIVEFKRMAYLVTAK